MSVRIMRAVWEYSKARGADFIVELYLANCENEDGRGTWVSVPTIARYTRLTERQVRISLRRLEASRALHVDMRAGPHGTNLYHLTTPEAASGGSTFPLKSMTGEGNVVPFTPEAASAKPEYNQKEPESTKGAEPPEALRRFHEILREAGDGQYRPTGDFFKKVADKYANALDLEETAIGIADWLTGPKNKHQRACSTKFVLGWLSRELKSTSVNVGDRSRSNGNHRSSMPGTNGAAEGISEFAKYSR